MKVQASCPVLSRHDPHAPSAQNQFSMPTQLLPSPPLPFAQKYRVSLQQLPGCPQAATSTAADQPFSLLACLVQHEDDTPAVAAAASAPLLDMPLLPDGQHVASSSLMRQLLELTTEGCSQPAGPPAEGCSQQPVSQQAPSAGLEGLVSLAELLPICPQRQAAQPLTSVTPMQLGEPPLQPAAPAFLFSLGNAQPVAQAATEAAAAASSAAGEQGAGCCPAVPLQLFTLEAPVLPVPAWAVSPGLAVAGAPTCTFAQLFQPVPVPEVAVQPTFVPVGCQPVSLASLVAQDLVLEDGSLMLPAVVLEEEGEGGGHAEMSGGREWWVLGGSMVDAWGLSAFHNHTASHCKPSSSRVIIT